MREVVKGRARPLNYKSLFKSEGGRKMKRKVLSVLLCIMMTAVLAAGCGSGKKDDGKKRRRGKN